MGANVNFASSTLEPVRVVFTTAEAQHLPSTMFHQLLPTVSGLAIVGICALPSAAALVSQLRSREPRSAWYEDDDGKSTPEAVAAFSAKTPKALILLFSLAGCGLSAALSVVSTLYPTNGSLPVNGWLSTATWGLILFQAISIAACRNSVRSYDLGLYTCLSALILSGLLLDQGTRLVSSLWFSDRGVLALRACELASALCLIFSSLAIPRRPEVFDKEGRLIDRQFSDTALSRFTFAWCAPILSLARKKNDLDLADLARPDHYTRAHDVSAAWKLKDLQGPLWWSLIRAHWPAFALQWTLTLATAFLNFAPQWVILQILRGLENYASHGDAPRGPELWVWVIWLGISIIVQSWVESYLFWLSFSDLCIPIRSQLSALIFEKSMRCKDVRGIGKNTENEGEGENNPVTSSAEDDDDEDEALRKSKQSTVNLIGVDAKRVTDFAAFNNFIPGSFFKLVVSLTFLGQLLGLVALLAGFSTMLIILPVNIFFTKRYSDAQDRVMKVRDQKTGVVTEALQGIRQIKFSALESRWEKKIGEVRERELKCVWDVFMADTMLIACWITSPILLSAAALAVYAAVHGSLMPSVAFVSLGIFKALEVTLAVVPELITDLMDALVSVRRIEKYLKTVEIEKVTKDAPEVSFNKASVAWPVDEETSEDERFVLRNLDVTFPQGELSVISGKTGTGKSLMLAAILGEADVLAGSISAPRAPTLDERHDDKANESNWIIPGAIAYVAQIPWLENASIRDNILFGLPYDKTRYEATIEACALRKDLEMLTDGEHTEIGANGVNLSGGQKWRMTLARAMYSRAGVLVLDDIFSAVDAHVGRHIFEKCLCGPLGEGRTRILVTHHVSLCIPKTTYLVELGDGAVIHSGLVSRLRADGILDEIKAHEQSSDEMREDEASSTAVASEESDDEPEADGNTLLKVTSKSTAIPKKFVEDETRDVGAIKKHVYATYLRDSGGWIFWMFAVVIFIVVQGLSLGRSWWLKIWTSNYSEKTVNSREENGMVYGLSVQHTSLYVLQKAPDVDPANNLWFYLGIYVALAVVTSFLSTLRFLYIYFGSIRASRRLFEKINFVVLRAPLRWLDTVPLGRILNRFTADFNIIDSNLANSWSFGAYDFLMLMGVVVAGLFVSPFLVLSALTLCAICLHYALVYLNGARPVKRLESTTKSPVFEIFNSALTGVTTIRAFDRPAVFVDRMHTRIDDFAASTWYLWLFNRWMGWRMALVGSFFATIVSVLILATPGMDPALAGFALAFAMEFSSCVVWTIRHYANIELNMNAAERIIEYTELPTESLDGETPPAAWPTEGKVDVKDLVVGYAEDLPPVLKGLNFSVKKNERIGVVGRTGAGKSSLTLALFRFLEARKGTIFIDGLDISKIKLEELRSRLAIIPQDPVLFSGTVRSNLDPFNQHEDAALLDSLHRVHLIPESGIATPALPQPSTSGTSTPTKNPSLNLSTRVSEGGLNLSQGQRQLLCLARAIVSRPKIMVLDEATSAVDMATDALIQSSIREEFGDATLLVIAHRLSTIADFDRILVLSDGQVAEYGTPRELWGSEDDGKDKWGIFRGMCEESGERDKLRNVVFGDS